MTPDELRASGVAVHCYCGGLIESHAGLGCRNDSGVRCVSKHPTMFATCALAPGHYGDHMDDGRGFNWSAGVNCGICGKTNTYAIAHISKESIEASRAGPDDLIGAAFCNAPINGGSCAKIAFHGGDHSLSLPAPKLKHGPFGSGLPGPCEPDCAKCAAEREPDPGEAKRLRALHCSCLCHLSGSPTEHAPTEYGGVHGACIRAESQAAASVLFDTPSPIARCACCGVKDETRGVPDPIGWMIIDFPAGSPREEEKRLCTLCGEKVAKFIAHLSTPMLGDEDMP